MSYTWCFQWFDSQCNFEFKPTLLCILFIPQHLSTLDRYRLTFMRHILPLSFVLYTICLLFISRSKHQVAACVILPIRYLYILSGCCPHRDLLLSSFLFAASIFFHFYCHALMDSAAPSLSSHPAFHLLSLLASLAPSSLPLIQSRSTTSQIDFAAVLRSPINSQIGFPA